MENYRSGVNNITPVDNELIVSISDALCDVLDNVNQRKTKFYQTMLHYRDYQSSLESHISLSSKPTRLIIVRGVGGVFTTVSLPQGDAERLMQYLIRGPSHETFDCQSFVHAVKGSRMRYPHRENGKVFFYKWIHVGHTDPMVGDYVLLTRTGPNGRAVAAPHHAYYLGDDLYVSKYGPKKGLYVTTIDEMSKHYDTDSYMIVRANPLHKDNIDI